MLDGRNAVLCVCVRADTGFPQQTTTLSTLPARDAHEVTALNTRAQLLAFNPTAAKRSGNLAVEIRGLMYCVCSTCVCVRVCVS